MSTHDSAIQPGPGNASHDHGEERFGTEHPHDVFESIWASPLAVETAPMSGGDDLTQSRRVKCKLPLLRLGIRVPTMQPSGENGH
jgi:hypothetical protein